MSAAPRSGCGWRSGSMERRAREDLRRSSSILATTSMGRCLASTSGGSPDFATRWEHVLHSCCISCFRDAINTFITSSIEAFSTMLASCFCPSTSSKKKRRRKMAGCLLLFNLIFIFSIYFLFSQLISS
ncbi:hypothetical protein VIGAN_08322900, partial [Vigna angularis var. angularis]